MSGIEAFQVMAIIFLTCVSLSIAALIFTTWITNKGTTVYEESPKRDIEAEVRREFEIINTIKDKVDKFIFSKESQNLIPEILEIKVMMIMTDNGYDELALINKVYLDAYCRSLSKYRVD